MKLLTEFRIFADHYQFFVYDSSADPCPESFYTEPDNQRSDLGSYQQGYITNGRTICFGTEAHLNNHWIEVYLSEQLPDLAEAQRVLALPLQVDSGKVAITNLLNLGEPISEIVVPSGQYTVYLFAFNLGVDEAREWERGDFVDDDRQLSDEELKAELNFERYKIVLVSGMLDLILELNVPGTLTPSVTARASINKESASHNPWLL